MTTLSERLQRAVALRDAPGRTKGDWIASTKSNAILCADDGTSLAHAIRAEDRDFIAAAPSIVQLAVELGAEVGRLEHRLQSGGYCAFCETTVAPLPGFLLSHVMRGHVETCEKHPLAAARAVLERLAKYPESSADEMSASTMRAIARQALSGGSENG